MKTSKIIILLIGTTAITFLILTALYSVRIKYRRDKFSLVEMGQSKEAVRSSMGSASETRTCIFPIYSEFNKYIGNCFEIYTYRGIYENWAIAFDNEGNVVEKYYWFLGEYGKRPPDVYN